MHLKKLCNYRRGSVKLSSINKTKSSCNFFIYKSINALVDLDVVTKVCIILSSDLRVECAVLNFKLRLKFKKTMLSIFGLGGCFSSAIITNYLSLRPIALINFAAGKIITLSVKSISFKAPIILIGESFYDRVSNFNCFLDWILANLPSSKVLKIQLLANNAYAEYLGLYSNFVAAKTGSLLTRRNFCCVLIEDTIFTRTNFVLKNFRKNADLLFSRFSENEKRKYTI